MKKIIVILLILVFSGISFGQTKETMTIRVYFSDPKSDGCDGKVSPVTRQIPKTQATAKAALDALFKGPTKEEDAKGYTSWFSDDTKSILKSVKVKNGAAYVNLDKSVMEKLGNATTSCGGRSYDASVEKTLKQFPSIRKIFFAVDGDPALYYDWMQIGECPKELKKCSGKDF